MNQLTYYVIRIFRDLEGKETRNILPFDNEIDAEVRYHSSLAADMSNTNNSFCMCLMIDERGMTYFNRNWYRPTPEPEVVTE